MHNERNDERIATPSSAPLVGAGAIEDAMKNYSPEATHKPSLGVETGKISEVCVKS